MTSIHLGSIPTLSSVHRDLLTSRSPFFAKALNGPFCEGADGVVKLPEEEPALFETYRQWLYTARIVCPIASDLNSGEEAFAFLFKAYVFGDKVQDTDFMDATMDSIILSTKKPSHGFPTRKLVNYAYDNTPPTSILRHVLVLQHVHYGKLEWVTDDDTEGDVSREFLMDFSKGLLQYRDILIRNTGDWASKGLWVFDNLCNMCKFHVHKEGEPCWKDKY